MTTNKIVAVGLIAIATLCAALVGYVVVSQSNSHQRVIDKFTLTDETKGYQLTAVLEDSEQKGWLSVSPYDVEIDFRTGSSYTQSFWRWENPSGDVDFSCTVWGPDETGHNYYVEFGRLTSHRIKIIYGDSITVFEEITDWSSQTYAGYPKPYKVSLED